MGIFSNNRKRREPEVEESPANRKAEQAEKQAEQMERQRADNPLGIMKDGFRNMGAVIKKAAVGYIERKKERKRIYQEEYRKAEKEHLKEQARKDARGEGQQQGNALQGLAEGLANAGNAFQQPPREKDDRRRENR